MAGVAGTAARFLLVAILLLVDLLIGWGVQAAGGFLEGLATASHLSKHIVSIGIKSIEIGEAYPSTHTTDQAETVSSGEVVVAARTHGAIGPAGDIATNARQVALATTSRAGERTTVDTPVHGVASARRRAVGAGVLPDLTQFTAKLLASHSPVVADVVTQLDDMALDLELVLLQPRDIKLLARGTALELTGDVLVVVADDTKIYQSGGSAFSCGVGDTYRVMIPVVLTPSVRWVTRNLPCCLMGA